VARRARFLGPLRVGPTATTAEGACKARAGSGVLRALRPVKALRLERAAGFADGLGTGFVDEFESVEGIFTEGLESRVERNRTCFPNGTRPREAKTSTLVFVAAIPMIKPITANENTSAATCNADTSKMTGV